MASGRKIVVTGATSLVGSHLVACLLAKGESVCAMRSEGSDISYVERIFKYYGIETGGRLEWVEGDVRDRLAMREILDGVSEVYNCASIMSFDKRDREMMWSVNIDGTSNVVEAARECGVTALCHLSYTGAIGHTTDGSPIDEKTAYQPDDNRTVYSQSKFRQEMEIWRGVEYGLDAVIVNPGIIIGPRGNETIKAIYQAEAMGMSKMGYVDVRDVAKAMIGLMEAKKYGERYILVAENISAQRLWEMYEEESGGINAEQKVTSLKKKISLIGKALKSVIGAGNNSKRRESINGISREYVSNKVKEAIKTEFTPIEQSIANEVKFQKQQ